MAGPALRPTSKAKAVPRGKQSKQQDKAEDQATAGWDPEVPDSDSSDEAEEEAVERPKAKGSNKVNLQKGSKASLVCVLCARSSDSARWFCYKIADKIEVPSGKLCDDCGATSEAFPLMTQDSIISTYKTSAAFRNDFNSARSCKQDDKTKASLLSAVKAHVFENSAVGMRVEMKVAFVESTNFSKFFVKKPESVKKLSQDIVQALSPSGELVSGVLLQRADVPAGLAHWDVTLYYDTACVKKDVVMAPEDILREQQPADTHSYLRKHFLGDLPKIRLQEFPKVRSFESIKADVDEHNNLLQEREDAERRAMDIVAEGGEDAEDRVAGVAAVKFTSGSRLLRRAVSKPGEEKVPAAKRRRMAPTASNDISGVAAGRGRGRGRGGPSRASAVGGGLGDGTGDPAGVVYSTDAPAAGSGGGSSAASGRGGGRSWNDSSRKCGALDVAAILKGYPPGRELNGARERCKSLAEKGKTKEHEMLRTLLECVGAAKLWMNKSTIQEGSTPDLIGAYNILAEEGYQKDITTAAFLAFSEKVASEKLQEGLTEDWFNIVLLSPPGSKAEMKWLPSMPRFGAYLIATEESRPEAFAAGIDEQVFRTTWCAAIFCDGPLDLLKRAPGTAHGAGTTSEALITLCGSFFEKYSKLFDGIECADDYIAKRLMKLVTCVFLGVVAILVPEPFRYGSGPEHVDFLRMRSGGSGSAPSPPTLGDSDDIDPTAKKTLLKIINKD